MRFPVGKISLLCGQTPVRPLEFWSVCTLEVGITMVSPNLLTHFSSDSVAEGTHDKTKVLSLKTLN